MQISINELPENLTYLGNSAFWNAGPNVIVTKIPKNIETLSNFCFTFCPKVQVTEFGSDDGSSLLSSIGDSCFYGAGKYQNGGSITSIVFYKSIIDVKDRAFYEYKMPNLNEVVFKNNESIFNDKNQNRTTMGFTNTNVNVVWGNTN